MRNLNYTFVICLYIGALSYLPQVILDTGKSCSINDLSDEGGCGPNESCVAFADSQDRCVCNYNYRRENDACVPIIVTTTTIASNIDGNTANGDSDDGVNGSSVAAGLLIPIFVLSIVISISLTARKYKWIQRFQQYRARRYGTVLVTKDGGEDDDDDEDDVDDDDDDDPPIA